jgi:hypothetical protein
VAIGEILEKHFVTEMGVVLSNTDFSRMEALRDEEAEYTSWGIRSYFTEEGVLKFAAKDWELKPVGLIMANLGTFGLSLATARDASIKTITDLRGKRASLVRGNHALNYNALAYLALAGLTWNNLEKETVFHFVISFDAIIEGRAGTPYSSNICPSTKKRAVSPRGLYWLPLSHGDEFG